MHVTIITLGSHGDVQPYIALGCGLRAAGHSVRVATHAYFETFVRTHDLEFFPVAGDPQELLEGEAGRDWLDTSNNPVRFARGLARLAGPLVQRSALDCWHACQGTEAIIASRLGYLAGHDIAEKLQAPFFAAYLQPFTPTRAFPNIYVHPKIHLGGGLNLLTHFISEYIFWHLFRSYKNTFRREVLGLPRLPFNGPLSRKWGSRWPVLYGFSPVVVPRPPEWDELNVITGYWFLDDTSGWQPPAGLVDFLKAGEPPVYVGFGSMTNRDPEEATALVLEALESAGRRGVLLRGWGGLSESELQNNIFKLDHAPHEWLFPRMAAVVHHGGAGTTAASLRAGVPTIIIPFFADQPFWGRRVYELGVGPRPLLRKQLSAGCLADAIREAVNDAEMQRRAVNIGKVIRAEDGVAHAVEAFQKFLVTGVVACQSAQ